MGHGKAGLLRNIFELWRGRIGLEYFWRRGLGWNSGSNGLPEPSLCRLQPQQNWEHPYGTKNSHQESDYTSRLQQAVA